MLSWGQSFFAARTRSWMTGAASTGASLALAIASAAMRSASAAAASACAGSVRAATATTLTGTALAGAGFGRGDRGGLCDRDQNRGRDRRRRDHDGNSNGRDGDGWSRDDHGRGRGYRKVRRCDLGGSGRGRGRRVLLGNRHDDRRFAAHVLLHLHWGERGFGIAQWERSERRDGARLLAPGLVARRADAERSFGQIAREREHALRVRIRREPPEHLGILAETTVIGGGARLTIGERSREMIVGRASFHHPGSSEEVFAQTVIVPVQRRPVLLHEIIVETLGRNARRPAFQRRDHEESLHVANARRIDLGLSPTRLIRSRR